VIDGCVDAGPVAGQRDGEELVHHRGLFLAWGHRVIDGCSRVGIFYSGSQLVEENGNWQYQ